MPKFGDIMLDGDGEPMGMYIGPKSEESARNTDPDFIHLIAMFHTDDGAWETIEDFPDSWKFRAQED